MSEPETPPLGDVFALMMGAIDKALEDEATSTEARAS